MFKFENLNPLNKIRDTVSSKVNESVIISAAVNIPADSFTTKARGLFTKHNEARVVNNKDLEAMLKDTGLEICEELIRS